MIERITKFKCSWGTITARVDKDTQSVSYTLYTHNGTIVGGRGSTTAEEAINHLRDTVNFWLWNRCDTISRQR